MLLSFILEGLNCHVQNFESPYENAWLSLSTFLGISSHNVSMIIEDVFLCFVKKNI